jgi:plastocyanin
MSPCVLEAYQEVQALKGRVIKGQVTFKGEIPKIESLEVNRDEKFCGESLPDDSLLVDSGSKGIANVVVNLKGIASEKPLPQKNPLQLDNRGCRFQPSVIFGVEGSMLNIENADPVLHNTHILQDDQTFLNVALPSGGRTIRKTLKEAGRLAVRCDAHKFMRASLHIFDHPYFTSTDETGHFELTQVPPGTHRIEFWHQTLGVKELTLTVNESVPSVINVSLP